MRGCRSLVSEALWEEQRGTFLCFLPQDRNKTSCPWAFNSFPSAPPSPPFLLNSQSPSHTCTKPEAAGGKLRLLSRRYPPTPGRGRGSRRSHCPNSFLSEGGRGKEGAEDRARPAQLPTSPPRGHPLYADRTLSAPAVISLN